MDLKYSVTEKRNSRQPVLDPQNGVCAVSCENIALFTKVFYHASPFKQSIPVFNVHAFDLNTPFETHIIMQSLDLVTRITFDSSGQMVLIVTSHGSIHLFTKGAGLHQWTNTHTSNWNGEDILFADFFHNKNKPHIQITDIKLNALYSEKFQCRSHQPTLSNVGLGSQIGFFAITASGLILACTVSSSGMLEEEARAILGPVRYNFVLAAASLAPSGRIHIAAWKPEIIKCWEIELSFYESERLSSKEGKLFGGISINGSRKLQINVQSAQSFQPQPSGNQQCSNSCQSIKVTHIKYTDQEDPNSLLLTMEVVSNKEKSAVEQPSPGTAAKNECEKSVTYLLQRYQLIEKTRAFYKFFQELSSSNESNRSTISVKEWTCQGEWISGHKILCFSTPQRYLFPGSSIPYALVISTSDGTLYTFNKDTMQVMNKYNFQTSCSDEMPPPKRPNANKQILSLAPTWTNLHFLAIDSNGGMHFLSLLKQIDVGTSWAFSVMLLLEYSLVTNCDYWDILIVTPPYSIVTVSERLTDNFYQHAGPIVANLLSKFLVLKNAMMRLSSTLHQRSIEARLQAHLSAILKLFHSLRPVTTDVISGDKNLTAVIHGYIESRNSLDFLDLDNSIENLLFSCNILDCQIDPALGQDLQILLQFSTDLALYLLLLLVQNPKYEIAKEPKILQFLREIMLISRLWYCHNKLVVPQMIKKTDSVDIWAQLYKLLTRLAQIIPNEPDTGFLDDCVVLETQVVCREVPLFIPPRGVIGCIASSTPSASPYPLQFTFDQTDPNPPVSNVNPRQLEGSLSCPHPLDPLCYHFLNASGPLLLQCTRCFAVRGSWWGSGDLTMWEQEWANKCICSGHWAPSSQHSSKAG